MISDRTRTVVLAVVTIIWAMNFFAGLVVEDYKPDQAINGIFMAVAGALFALGGRGGGGNGPGSGNEGGSSASTPPPASNTGPAQASDSP